MPFTPVWKNPLSEKYCLGALYFTTIFILISNRWMIKIISFDLYPTMSQSWVIRPCSLYYGTWKNFGNNTPNNAATHTNTVTHAFTMQL